MKFKWVSLLTCSIILFGCQPSSPTLEGPGEKAAQAPVYRPNMDSDAVSVWVAEAATAAYTFSYNTYLVDFENASRYFTPKGWRAFQSALYASGALLSVFQNKTTVTSSLTGMPMVLSEGDFHGRYSWTFQVPMIIHYKNFNGKTRDQHVMANLNIIRTVGNMGVRGLAIKDYMIRTIS
jgi:hypothetical protein